MNTPLLSTTSNIIEHVRPLAAKSDETENRTKGGDLGHSIPRGANVPSCTISTLVLLQGCALGFTSTMCSG